MIKAVIKRIISLISGWITSEVQSDKTDAADPFVGNQQHGPNMEDEFRDAAKQRSSTEQSRADSHENQFQCAVCDVSLTTPDGLGAHYRAGHDNTPNLGDSLYRVGGVGGIACPDCSLEFELPREQELHRIETHKVESPN